MTGEQRAALGELTAFAEAFIAFGHTREVVQVRDVIDLLLGRCCEITRGREPRVFTSEEAEDLAIVLEHHAEEFFS